MSNHRELAPISFGFPLRDTNMRMMKFIPDDVLSRLPLIPKQIDYLADYLNWDIMSSKEIPGPSFVKHKQRINWAVFLTNGKPKEINYLLDVADILQAHTHIFFDNRIKDLYFNKHFMLVFPQYVDWNWCAKHKRIDDYVLLKNWQKFDIKILSKYQHFSTTVASEKKFVIDWKLASRNPIEESVIKTIPSLVNWSDICRYQKLSEEFISNHKKYVDWIVVSKHQVLTESFILANKNNLDFKMISRYQELSIEFIKTNISLIDLDSLSKNKRFNKKNTTQILKSRSGWFIIEPPVIGEFRVVTFLEANVDVD